MPDTLVRFTTARSDVAARARQKADRKYPGMVRGLEPVMGTPGKYRVVGRFNYVDSHGDAQKTERPFATVTVRA